MTATRWRLLALAVSAAGAVLTLVSAGQPRWSDQSGTSSGHAPAATALGLVALAGVGFLLIARGPLRTGVGALLVLAGVGILVADLRVGSGLVTQSPVVPRADASRTSWFWLTAVGGVLVVVGGAVVTGTAHRWAQGRRRYDAPGPAGQEHREQADGARDAWTAIDRGEDPTL